MGKLIILIVVILGAIAVAQLVRLYEHNQKLKKSGEHEVNDRDNNLNAWLMLTFNMFQFGGLIYLMLDYGYTGLGPAASIEGVETDWLLNLNFVIILAVFFLTNFLLFYFSFKYVRKEGVRATYFPHNNKLELIWTTVPAIVLAVIIILGLRTWNEVTAPATEDAVVIELYAKQYGWTARYSGENGVLGKYDYKLYDGTNNPLGLITQGTIDNAINLQIKKINEYDSLLSNTDDVLSDSTIEAYEFTLSHRERILRSLYQLKENHDNKIDQLANDDVIITDKLVLCVDQEYEFNMRAQDVIHSAYFPHFRAQMNAVPGMTTRMNFTPNITTEEMREIKGDPKFNYYLLCNKICGGGHYKMAMPVEVLSKKEFKIWWNSVKSEKSFGNKGAKSEEESSDDKKKDEKEGSDESPEDGGNLGDVTKNEDEDSSTAENESN